MKIRNIARIVLEATSPLSISSGEASMLTDSLVARDHFGLPMIPGTALTGVLSHSFTQDERKKIFGYQDGDKGEGSRLIISSAYMVQGDGCIIEDFDLTIDERVRQKYIDLPSRQHVRITHKGTAKDQGLFDNEVVYKGTRFKFEIELMSESPDNEWTTIMSRIQSPLFRLGGGTRKGYGELKVIEIKSVGLDLRKSKDIEKSEDIEKKIALSTSLNKDDGFQGIKLNEKNNISGYIHYELKIKPDSFFIFSEGFGDAEAYNKPLEEDVVSYINNK